MAEHTLTWYSLPLGDALTSSGPAAEIEASFRLFHETPEAPPDAAVLTRLDSEGRLHCEVTAFFSPACGALARSLGARPCSPPARAGLILLVGDERAWDRLFP
jgi:hypothetical protein